MSAYVTGDSDQTIRTRRSTCRLPAPDIADILGRVRDARAATCCSGATRARALAPQEQFGTDEDIGGANRSDTIILVHTRPGQKEAIFLSFPRDLWVDIPGIGMGRINSAFEGGIQGNGPARVARTVKELTGMQIHHVMYVSLAGFEGLVDALGGVDMCVPYPMQDELTGLDIEAGCQRFDGATSLAYVRTRHQPCDAAAPDFARIGRQQQFLRAVISGLLQPSACCGCLTSSPSCSGTWSSTRAQPGRLRYLAGQLEDVGSRTDFRTVPSTPAGIYGTDLPVVCSRSRRGRRAFRRLRGPVLGDRDRAGATAPSPAHRHPSSTSAGDGAAEVLGVLTDGVQHGAGDRRHLDVVPPTKGDHLYRPGGGHGQGRGTYFPNMALVPAPPGTLLPGQDVAGS
jgi:LCP family protein required for cell wall assembly